MAALTRLLCVKNNHFVCILYLELITILLPLADETVNITGTQNIMTPFALLALGESDSWCLIPLSLHVSSSLVASELKFAALKWRHYLKFRYHHNQLFWFNKWTITSPTRDTFFHLNILFNYLSNTLLYKHPYLHTKQGTHVRVEAAE